METIQPALLLPIRRKAATHVVRAAHVVRAKVQVTEEAAPEMREIVQEVPDMPDPISVQPIVPPHQRKTPILVLLTALLILGTAVYAWGTGFFGLIENRVNPFEREELKSAITLAEQGHFSDAAAQAAPLTSSDDGFVRGNARTVEAVGAFMSGEEAERIRSIQMVKEDYMNATQPTTKAFAINTLFGYIMAGREQYVFDEIFNGEPFGEYRVENDWSSSVRNLAELSLSLYPSTEALFRLGQWHSVRLSTTAKDHDVVTEEKRAHADEILKILDRSVEIYPQHLAVANAVKVFPYMVTARYYFWRGYLYGSVATVYPQYLPKMEEEYNKLFEFYETERDELGNRRPLIAGRLTYAHSGYANYLYVIKGESAYPEIREHLDRIIELVEEDPETHAGQFVSLIREQGKLSPDKRGGEYKVFARLAAIHPPYKEFLAKYGLTL